MGEDFYRWSVGTIGGGMIEASNGIAFGGQDIDTLAAQAEVVMVCGGAKIELVDDRDIARVLRAAVRRGIAIGAISTGSELLARIGLLDGYRCTIHWENRPAFREAYPRVNCTDKIFEIDRKRITCSGGIAVIDLMLDRIRSADDVQRTGTQPSLKHAPPGLRKAVRIMRDHIEDTLSIAQIAAHVGICVRQLQRLFLHHLGVSPAHYYIEIRLHVGRDLLMYSDQSISSIAIAIGFSSVSHFAIWFRRQFGIRPSDVRMSN
jgi:transcriptional regulator GlxA family with amidase domain